MKENTKKKVNKILTAFSALLVALPAIAIWVDFDNILKTIITLCYLRILYGSWLQYNEK
jgi:hypothetical protein